MRSLLPLNNSKGFVGKALGQLGLKCLIWVGETGFREVAAYLLDYEHFANVPPTALDMQMKEREVQGGQVRAETRPTIIQPAKQWIQEVMRYF
ncbi:hypothetical protein AHAS_Ahas15G0121500 [Arachis hypogaea]